MAADVSSLVRALNGYMDNRKVGNESSGGDSTTLITRDLLGDGFGCNNNKSDSQELNLDMVVPIGWEKRLDLESGKVYLQRYNSSISSSSSSDHKDQSNRTIKRPQDFNVTHLSSLSPKVTLNLFDDHNLELKLISSSTLFMTQSSFPTNYQNVCTIDKVKAALERAEKEPSNKRKIRWKSSSSSSSSFSSSSSLIREIKDERNDETFFPSPIAMGCPNCLSYVLIMKRDSKCPRCSGVLPISMSNKKPRIDLNISI